MSEIGPQEGGGLNVAVAHGDGHVMLDFGVPIAWLALEPQSAADFAVAVLIRAHAAAKQAGISISITTPIDIKIDS